MRVLPVRDADLGHILVGMLNSSTYYVFTMSYSDCRNIVTNDVVGFPFGLKQMSDSLKSELLACTQDLMADFHRNSVRRTITSGGTGAVQYQEFYIKKSKSAIDEIDRVLAKHYGFTDEELDFIINYDIKYRMGREAEEE